MEDIVSELEMEDNVEEIIGGTITDGSIYFLVKLRDSEVAKLIPAKEANVKIPQIVIKFYEGRLKWLEDNK